MTIRKTLLRAFLLIGLVPAILLAALAFINARAAMQAEIEHSLLVQAQAVAADINKGMFERLQNAATWSTLEVMQDLQVQDIDKRLSLFLARLKSGYGGVYRDLHALNREQLILSSSNPTLIGHVFKSHPVWQTTTLAGSTLILERPQRAGSAATLTIRTPIHQQMGGAELGELVLEYDWTQIDGMLDSAASGGRMLALADAVGEVVARSRIVGKQDLLPQTMLSEWDLHARPEGAFERSGLPFIDADVLVGLGRAREFAGFAGMGLSALVIQPKSDALAPVQRMAQIFFAILAAVLLVTLVAAGKISGAIARPIIALTSFTRGYKPGESSEVTPPAATGEVGELGRAFTHMVQEIDQAQSDLVRASKLAVVGEMASVIFHEIRTPLGILRSSGQMLRRESGISAEGRELVGFIESETERLNRLVSSMLDSARPRALNMSPIDLHALIRQTRSLLGAQIDKVHIHVVEHLAAIDPIVDGDAEQIMQVLLNLLHNALQVVPKGGTIEIRTELTMTEFIIDIADNGPGIAPAERARIFEPFFSRREGGVGLGLAIVQQIIFAHGGTIKADASELGGARMTINLPRPGKSTSNSSA